MEETLREELFFFYYHFSGLSREDSMGLPVHERKWMIQRFIEQKKKEQEAMDKAKRANKGK